MLSWRVCGEEFKLTRSIMFFYVWTKYTHTTYEQSTQHWNAFASNSCPRKTVSIIYLCVCVCARARARELSCVCQRSWACACACVHVALLIQHATRIRHIVTSFVAPLAPPHFSTLSHKGTILETKKKSLNIKRVFWFSLQLLSRTFLFLRRIQRDIVIKVRTYSCKVPVILVGF